MADNGLVGAPGRQRLEGTIVAGEISWEVEMDRGIVMVFFTAPHYLLLGLFLVYFLNLWHVLLCSLIQLYIM
jgi:hypothetical protein